jgi:hypothetical protein
MKYFYFLWEQHSNTVTSHSKMFRLQKVSTCTFWFKNVNIWSQKSSRRNSKWTAFFRISLKTQNTFPRIVMQMCGFWLLTSLPVHINCFPYAFLFQLFLLLFIHFWNGNICSCSLKLFSALLNYSHVENIGMKWLSLIIMKKINFFSQSSTAVGCHVYYSYFEYSQISIGIWKSKLI